MPLIFGHDRFDHWQFLNLMPPRATPVPELGPTKDLLSETAFRFTRRLHDHRLACLDSQDQYALRYAAGFSSACRRPAIVNLTTPQHRHNFNHQRVLHFETSPHPFNVLKLLHRNFWINLRAQSILLDLTYGEGGLQNLDPALQPLIQLKTDRIAISPALVLGIDVERNFTVLLNRMSAEKKA